ncbi:TPA: general secretion pathway protein GspM [Pseudomonas putida]|uniref:General secretion pathway protein GspM, putative n=1 Tax=Pseudomonas putida (strain W619) TaxID=390235 RepID=B1J7E6_PSEPW|nr:type II secretion system protein GspM [Pseudomonas putida]QQE86179.1 general secretion pathway protein GspM [Pseudomonas putida]HEN8710518.1 general secretion pathway protein GspM [Pseudomonas putida]HEN8714891.1 general secretion pathway protein GspM [Pseudomonas putida]
MRPLTSRERKLCALGVLALLLWLAWYLVFECLWLAPLRSLDAQAQTLREQQRRYASLMLQQPELQAQLQRSRNDPAQRNSLLPGEDPNAVAADLMQRAVDQVKAQAHVGPGCDITQRMPIAPAEQDQAEPYRPVKVSLTLACAIEPLAALLHALEYGQPSLFIDQLSIRRSAAAPAKGPAGRLEVHLLIRGYLHAQPAEGSDS